MSGYPQRGDGNSTGHFGPNDLRQYSINARSSRTQEGNSGNPYVSPDSELPWDHTTGRPQYFGSPGESSVSHAASLQTEQGTADSNTIDMASVPDEMVMDIGGVPTVVKVDKTSASKRKGKRRADNAASSQTTRDSKTNLVKKNTTLRAQRDALAARLNQLEDHYRLPRSSQSIIDSFCDAPEDTGEQHGTHQLPNASGSSVMLNPDLAQGEGFDGRDYPPYDLASQDSATWNQGHHSGWRG
nr:hypothetical protein L203_04335 [Cryptococcus depauperatus CBS 7841]